MDTKEHLAEATRLLDAYDGMAARTPQTVGGEAALNAALTLTQARAQVHATLALATAQQEANDIARAAGKALLDIFHVGTGDHGFQIVVMNR